MVAELAHTSQVRFYAGDMREVLARLEPEFAQCVMTSPPFWGLRDYKIPPSVWGQTCCDHPHEWTDAPWRWYPGGNDEGTSTLSGGGQRHQKAVGSELVHASMGQFCSHVHEWQAVVKPAANGIVNGAMQGETLNATSGTRRPTTSGLCGCGAWYGQLGLEPTPEMYVEHIVEAFRWVWRALKKDGVLWLEIGDSYAGSGKGPSNSLQRDASCLGEASPSKQATNRGALIYSGESSPAQRLTRRNTSQFANGQAPTTWLSVPRGVKPKDLLLIPARVALALQADGWWVRNDNVWSKPNPMPESVKDRTTRAHSYVFQLTKSRRCFYDWKAIAEPAQFPDGPHAPTRIKSPFGQGFTAGRSTGALDPDNPVRNKRTVWTIPTAPFSGWHLLQGQDLVECGAADYVGLDGNAYRASPGCPEHARLAGSHTQRTAGRDERSSPTPIDSLGNASHRVGEPEGVSHATAPPASPGFETSNGRERSPQSTRENTTFVVAATAEPQSHRGIEGTLEIAASSSDSADQSCSDAAIPHNNGSHRMAPARATTQSCSASAQSPERTPRNGESPDLVDSVARTDESSNGLADSGGHPSAQTKRRSAGKAAKCPCRIVLVDHFATFPPELVVDPIKATSRPGDVVLDPFSGAGTVAMVAARLGRDSVGIDAKPSYIRMAQRRVLADCPMFVEVQIDP